MPTRQPTPSVQFSGFLSRFPADIVSLVKRCLPKIRRVAPCPFEIVYDYANSVVVSFSMSERGYEAIVALAIFPDSVKLYFDKSLPDPKRLLKGSGTKVRSVTVKTATDLNPGTDVDALFRAAIKNAGASFPKKRKAQMIIKSGSKKPVAKNQKPKKGG